MTTAQRAEIDALLRKPQPNGELAADFSIEVFRDQFAATMAQTFVPDEIRTRTTKLGNVAAMHVTDPTSNDGVGTMLYFHGGWFVAGSPTTALSVTSALVSRANLPSYSVDYRLAPEHPFPAALDDALDAYRALLEAGHAPASIAFAGDSAGGNLAVTSCLAARSQGLPQPAAVVAFSGCFDATCSGASMDTKNDIDPIFTRSAITPFIESYLGAADARQALVSPALTTDLTGLPPMLLQVGGNEVLLDDSVRLAASAANSNVDVVLDVTADVPHVFQSFVGMLDEADEALDRACEFLIRHLAA